MDGETKQIDLSWRLFVLAVIIIAALTIFYLVNAVLTYKTIPDNYPREITVSGEGKAYVVPDIAILSLSIVTEGMDTAVIIQKNTEKMNGLIQDIKDLGIDEKDIRTTNYSLTPQYNWTKEQGQIFIGYKLTNTISVKVRDFAKIGSVLGKANDRGANLISGINFSIEDPEKARQEAREKAIEQAKNKAASIAKTSGLKLVKLLNVQEGYYPYYYGATYEKAVGEGSEMAMPTPQIEPGQTEVSVNVTLTYRVR